MNKQDKKQFDSMVKQLGPTRDFALKLFTVIELRGDAEYCRDQAIILSKLWALVAKDLPPGKTKVPKKQIAFVVLDEKLNKKTLIKKLAKQAPKKGARQKTTR